MCCEGPSSVCVFRLSAACARAARVVQIENYKDGITYAVHTLSRKAPHAALYIDAAHGGWMGYEVRHRIDKTSFARAPLLLSRGACARPVFLTPAAFLRPSVWRVARSGQRGRLLRLDHLTRHLAPHPRLLHQRRQLPGVRIDEA